MVSRTWICRSIGMVAMLALATSAFGDIPAHAGKRPAARTTSPGASGSAVPGPTSLAGERRVVTLDDRSLADMVILDKPIVVRRGDMTLWVRAVGRMREGSPGTRSNKVLVAVQVSSPSRIVTSVMLWGTALNAEECGEFNWPDRNVALYRFALYNPSDTTLRGFELVSRSFGTSKHGPYSMAKLSKPIKLTNDISVFVSGCRVASVDRSYLGQLNDARSLPGSALLSTQWPIPGRRLVLTAHLGYAATDLRRLVGAVVYSADGRRATLGDCPWYSAGISTLGPPFSSQLTCRSWQTEWSPGYTGIQMCSYAPTDLLRDRTLHVRLIDPRGPAAVAGVKLGDIVHYHPADPFSPPGIGSSVKEVFRRDGKEISIPIHPTKDPIFGDLMEHQRLAVRKLLRRDRDAIRAFDPMRPLWDGFDPVPRNDRVDSYRFVSYETVPLGFRPAKVEFYISPSPSNAPQRIVLGIDSVRLP